MSISTSYSSIDDAADLNNSSVSDIRSWGFADINASSGLERDANIVGPVAGPNGGSLKSDEVRGKKSLPSLDDLRHNRDIDVKQYFGEPPPGVTR